MVINFISSKDVEEEHVMHSNSVNIKFTPYSDANHATDELFKSLCSIYREHLETSMKGSILLQMSCCGGLYIDSPDWIKKKKAIINPRNMDNKCFQYSTTIALNYEEIESNPENVSNNKPFKNNIIGKK